MKKESTAPLAQRENGTVLEDNGRFGRSFSSSGPAINRPPSSSRFTPQPPAGNTDAQPNHEDDDEEGDGGFDLAKGFAPIASGSFHSQRSSSLGVARAGS
jgi:hypothetical protein